jgi:hypothetical protein
MYFLKGGILDGKAGFTIAMLKAMYEYEICLKIGELRRKEKGLSI